MWAHYSKLAVKVLWRRKVFTFISLFGVSFTLVVLMVVAAMLDHVLSSGAPETHLSRTLHVSYVALQGEHQRSTGGPGYGLLDHYMRDLPGVERMAIVSEGTDVNTFVRGEKIVSSLRYADDQYWQVLDFAFVEGAPYGPEDERSANHVAVISETTRRRFFGAAPCVGKMLEAGGDSYRILGVVKDVPVYRRAAAGDIWVPISTTHLLNYKNELRGGFQGLLLARDAADFASIRAEFAARLARVQIPDAHYTTISGRPMTRLEQNALELAYSDPAKPNAGRFILLLSGASLLFMLLPSINLININVSRIFERSSEIGVRKAFGASSARLVGQFVFENVVLCLVGGVVGFLGAVVILHFVNASGVVANADFRVNLRVFGYALGLAVFFGCLSGAYPAWRMARLRPVAALRGDTR